LSGARVLAVVDDLMVRSRIEAAARAGAGEVMFPASEVDLDQALETTLQLVVVGMAATRKPWPAWIRRIKAHPRGRSIQVIAFGPHRDLALREQALASGADRVVANSAFMAQLASVMSGEAPVDDAES
jgi:CheY-like chemotaxis protein